MNARPKNLAKYALLAAVVLLGAAEARAQECEETPEGAVQRVCYETEDVREDYEEGRGAWSASGAAGNVDEGSRSLYGHVGSHAYVKSSRTGTAILRYPVDCRALADLKTYAIIYKDDGGRARVRAKLMVSTPLSEEPAAIAEFDSDDHGSSTGLQGYVGGVEDTHLDEDEACRWTAAHWEVRLTRGSGGDPRFVMMNLVTD